MYYSKDTQRDEIKYLFKGYINKNINLEKVCK